MTRLFGGVIFAMVLLLGAGAPPVQASSLSPSQISAILGLLQAFGADSATIANVNSVLGGTTTTTTINPPTITKIGWAPGSSVASSTISIIGTNLKDTTRVDFYSATTGKLVGSLTDTYTASQRYIHSSDSTVSVYPISSAFPANLTGALQVRVVTPSGTSNALSFSFSTATPKLTVAKYGGLSDQTISAGTNNVILGSFTLSAGSTGDVRIDTITLSLSHATWVGNLRLNDGPTILNNGMISSPSTSNSFNIDLAIPAGTTKKIDIRGDISAGDTSSSGVAIQSTITQITGSVPAISTSLPLQTITIVSVVTPTTIAPKLTVTKSPSYSGGIVSQGTTRAKIGSFMLTAGSAEDIMVNTISFSLPNAILIKNLMLEIGSNIYGSIISSPATSDYIKAGFVLPAGTVSKIDIYGDIASNASVGSEIQTTITSIASTGYVTNTPVSVASLPLPLQTITIGSTYAPNVTFTASPTTVVSGSSATLSWSSTNATSCAISGPPPASLPSWSMYGNTSGSGSTGPLTSTITYNLKCTGASGTASQSVTITVTPKPTASALSAVEGLAQNSSFQYDWNTNLQIGSSNSADVTALQTALAKEGVYSGEITGGFYSQTFGAVKAFQQKYGINATGFVGPATREKLNSLY